MAKPLMRGLLAPRKKKSKEIEWGKVFQEDQASPKRVKWVQQAKEGRQYMEKNFDPLEKYGLDEEERESLPVVKYSSIPRVIRSLFGRIFANPMKPTVAPYEGKRAEEDVTRICWAIFSYEMSQKRGPLQRNLVKEIKKTAWDALVNGMGFTDARIDLSLRTGLFPRGKPVYSRYDPFDVVLDRTAGRYDDIRHAHLKTAYTKEEFEQIFKKDPASIRQVVNEDNPDPESENMVYVIETQFRRVELVENFLLSHEAQIEIGLPLGPVEGYPGYGLVDKKSLQLHIEQLKKANPNQFDYLNYSDFTRNIDSFEQLSWGIYSTHHDGGDNILVPEEYIGHRLSFKKLGFFPADNSSYCLGVPYFLTDLQAFEIMGRTVQGRILMRGDRPGYISKVKLRDDVLERLAENRIGGVDSLELDDIDAPIRDILMARDYSGVLPFLQEFLNYVHYTTDEQFGTTKEQFGQVPFAGASGKLIERLLMTGTFMFVVFLDEMNEFLPDIYDRVLRLASYAMPKSALMMIAGEQDEGRAQLIQTGKFHQRIDTLNADVSLDTTTEQDRMLQKDFVVTLAKAGMASPYDAALILGLDEPEKFAQSVEQWQMKQNEDLRLGKVINSAPELKDAVNKLIQQYSMLTRGRKS